MGITLIPPMSLPNQLRPACNDMTNNLLGKLVAVMNWEATGVLDPNYGGSGNAATDSLLLDPQYVVGRLASASAEFTTAAPTTSYSANDIIGPGTGSVVLTFSGLTRGQGLGAWIQRARVVTNSAAALGNVRLTLYRQELAETTGFADNDPFRILWANRAIRIGSIDMTLATGGAGSDSSTAFAFPVNLPVVSTDAQGRIFGVLTAQGTIAKTASMQVMVELATDRY
jgi:hypothetical protein